MSRFPCLMWMVTFVSIVVSDAQAAHTLAVGGNSFGRFEAGVLIGTALVAAFVLGRCCRRCSARCAKSQASAAARSTAPGTSPVPPHP